MTSRTDPLGRRTSYVYAANGIDLVEVRQTTGTLNELLASYSNYTATHLPQTITDAAGQSTTVTYNAAGQILTVTNANSETTTYVYDGNGRVQSVTGPVAGDTKSYTYDTAGRVRTLTDSDGYVITKEYDAIDRVTRVTYPDNTYVETRYDRLDPVEVRDRLGRWTRAAFDSLRRIVSRRDPAGRVITQTWCTCGSMDSLTDAKGQQTRWEYDIAGRVTKQIRADGTTHTTYSYESSTNRVKTVTDLKQQIATYSYDRDNNLQSIVFTNAAIATPSIQYTYEPGYNRLATMTDGSGVTTYAYHPVGALGAGQIASVDGPLTDDVITYTHDQLGRLATRTINDVGITQTYDALGRVTTQLNSLGTFTYGYDGATSRLASVVYPNLQTTTYTYFGNLNDHRLQTIHHQRPGGVTLSKFDYTYDAAGNILTWQQQSDSAPPVVWAYAYDQADQLLAAVQSSTTTTPAVLKRYGYAYDAAGNRTTEQIDGTVVESTYDTLNRLLQQHPGGTLRFAGTVNEPATVTIQGRPATVSPSNDFSGAAAVSSGTNMVTVEALDASGNTVAATYQIDATGATKTFTFDANGNLSSDGTRTFEWDARNQLVAVNVGARRTEYSYDGKRRVVRVVEKLNGVAQTDIKRIWCGTDVCEERSASGNVVTRRLYDYGEDTQSGAKFVSKDHLGTAREYTNATGTLEARYTFDPFGRRTLVFGTDASDVGFTNHRHAASGLVLTHFRSYDPEIGRWISEDPIGLRGSLNFYGYVENRPVRLFDPFGLQAVDPKGCNATQQSDLQNAYSNMCKKVNGDRKCQSVMAQSGVKSCMEKDCKQGITVICCQDCGGCGNNPPSQGPLHTIVLAPAGFRGGAACGGRDHPRQGPNGEPEWPQGVDHTLTHEVAHCGIGGDPHGRQGTGVFLQNWRRAEDVAYACRGSDQ